MRRLLIQTPAPNFSASVDFYRRANFKTLSEKENETIVGDKNLTIKVNGDASARLGICLYTNHYHQIIASLHMDHQSFQTEDEIIFSDPNGVRLYLYPLDKCPLDALIPECRASGLGNFAGVGIESVDYENTITFWKNCGFTSSGGDIVKHKYETFTIEGGFDLTIYQPGICPHAFFNLSLTYFNGKQNNPRYIEFVRLNKLPITEEITAFNPQGIVDNIIIGDPGGLHTFLFND